MMEVWNQFWKATFKQKAAFILIWTIAMPLANLSDLLADISMLITTKLYEWSSK